MELNSSFQKLLKASREKKAKLIAFVVIDEAHLVEDWYVTCSALHVLLEPSVIVQFKRASFYPTSLSPE